MAHTLILNGEVVSLTGTVAADVLIDGTIAAVGAPGFFTEAAPTAEKVIDAGGKYVIPGGIDVHTYGAAVRRHVRLRHVRLHCGRRGSADHDHRLRGTERRRVQEGLAEWQRKAEGRARSTTGSTRSSAGSTTSR